VQHAKQTAMNVEKTVKQYRDDLDSLKKMAPYEDLLVRDSIEIGSFHGYTKLEYRSMMSTQQILASKKNSLKD